MKKKDKREYEKLYSDALGRIRSLGMGNPRLGKQVKIEKKRMKKFLVSNGHDLHYYDDFVRELSKTLAKIAPS